MTQFLKQALAGVLLLFIFVLVLVGCNDGPTPPPPAISNERRNEITERESLVKAFATADVVGIPADSHKFLVRDTNGIIWYVSTESEKEGRTRMFGWHAEFPPPAPPPVVYITNYVTLTNNVISVEDTAK